MARIRTIKPEFFTSEDIVALSPYARLLYIALWCEADKEGRMHWKPKTFKMRYLPADDVDISCISSELIDAGLVVRYSDGLAYIPQFSKHQHVNPRESVSILPAPDGICDALPKKVGKTTRELVFERDGHACVRCGSTENLSIDHILPQGCGGPHIAENLRVLCKSCNSARPVAGAALDDDLALDGYTINSLRKKFGIDASIHELNAHVGREGKGKEGKGKEGKGMEVASRERETTPKAKPPASIQKPDDVSEQTWADWVQLRKGHKAAITETVIKAAQSEAIKAGLPLEQFMTVWCLRGSRGLEASWLKPHERGLPVIARVNGGDPNAEAKRLLGFDDQGTIDA